MFIHPVIKFVDVKWSILKWYSFSFLSQGFEMINQEHFQHVSIKEKLDELHRLWELLLTKLSEKGLRLQQVRETFSSKFHH